MVVTMDNELLKKCETHFRKKDIKNTLDCFEKALTLVDKTNDQAKYVSFLKEILEYCRVNKLLEQEAVVLRALGRTHSIFNQHYESLSYHRESLKIQRKLGRKLEVAMGLVLMGESLDFNENYQDCINAYKTAAGLFHELGKLRKQKNLKKEISRIEAFSRETIEDEYMLNKFGINRDY